jgi:phage-related minor tail protein
MYYAKERELQKEAYDYFQNIEKDKADKMKERYEVELAETQKFWEAYQKYIETSRDIELQVTTDRNRYIDLRIQKMQEEYDEYQKQGINSVLLDQWRADQIKKIYSEIPDNIKNISDIVQKNMSNISANITNVLGNTIYDFISGTKSMKDAWNNAWEAMAEITMRIISQIIAQMIELFFMQKLVGLATGGIGGAGTIPSIAPGAFEIPPAPIASTGRNNLSTININNQQNELMMSIDGLKREIASSREQNFNLYLDGLPLRNAIKRVEKNLNIMGS